MTRRTPADQRMLATARLVENLAELLPEVRRHARVEMGHADGFASTAAAAGHPGDSARRPAPDGDKWCTANVPSEEHDDELVDCGRPRPCPDHDDPVVFTAVERAAAERMRIEHWLDDIEAQCVVIATVALQALKSGRSLIGERVALEVPRCSAEGREGSIEWADPTCTDAASRGSLCDRCAKREYRWRVEHGLPRRTDGVFSQPAADDVPSA